MLEKGLTFTAHTTVTENNTAATLGSGDMNVFATPALVALMDDLAEDCTEAEYRRLEEIFVNCSRYELGFWEMAWTLEK